MNGCSASIMSWLCSLPDNIPPNDSQPNDSQSNNGHHEHSPPVDDLLADVLEAITTCPIPSKKRKRQPQLTSPPASYPETMTSRASTPKRRRRTSVIAGADPDATPRPAVPGRISIPAAAAAAAAASSPTSSSHPSQASHASHAPSSRASASASASSPKKQMLSLRLHEPILEFNALSPNLQLLPSAARDLVQVMTEIGSNQDILPHAVQPSIMQSVNARDPMPRLWRYAFKPAADDDDDAMLPGRIPSFAEVERLCRKATECQEYHHEEVSWNSSVHTRLLELVLEDEQGRQCDEFDAMICTTARLHQAWKPIYSPAKMIDICLYHTSTSTPDSDDRHEDGDLRAKMTRFSRLTPTGTVNHTDFYPLSLRPIVLSIETKRPGTQWDKAQLQIGIWHAAQWAFLRWAVADKLQRRQSSTMDVDYGRGEREAGGSEGNDMEAEVLSIMSKLGFIPGVIVQGHGWHLVLSTYEDRKTKLWADRQFGSTQTCIEAYSVIAGMRRLTAWARDVYMPWFKLYVLDNDNE